MNTTSDSKDIALRVSRNESVCVAISELLRSRRTIHLFRKEKPSENIIRKAIEHARWAPNHRLTEPWRFYLIGNHSAQQIAELNARIVTEKQGKSAGEAKLQRWRDVPGWLVVTCQRSENGIRQQEDYAACCCAIQNFMLFLWGEGIGVKWTTGDVTRDPQFFTLLQIDTNQELLVGLFWYGFPAEIPQAQPRLLEEIVLERP